MKAQSLRVLKMNFTYTANPAPGVMILQPKRDNAGPTLAFTDQLTQHDRIGGPLTQVQTSFATIAETLAHRSGDLSDDGFSKEARRLVDDKLRPPHRLTVEATYAAQREFDAEWRKLNTPRFSDESDPAVRAEQRTWWRGLSTPAKLETANADPALAAAVVEGGFAASGLPRDVFDRLTRTMGEGQLADAIMRGQEFSTAPSPDDPIAGHPDRAAALKVATARFERMEAERDLLATVSPLLATLITAVAMITGESRQAAFERLSL
ncbi:hypothetical protein ACWPMX_06555 [Tsuneonella sp. HG094]